MDRDESVLAIIEAKASGTVAIFDVGDLYRVYGDDAAFISSRVLYSDCGLTRGDFDGQEILYLNLNNAQYTRAVKELLLVCNYRVEVYELVDEEWIQQLKGSQTNMIDFEDIVGDSEELAELATSMAIANVSSKQQASYNEIHLAVVFVNIYDRRITFVDFVDDEHLSLFQKFHISMNPRQCFLANCGDSKTPDPIKAALKRVKIAYNDFSIEKGIGRDLGFFLKRESNDDVANTLSSEILTLGANLLNLIEVGNEYEKQFSLCRYRNDLFMRLDSNVIRALEVFDSSGDHDDGIETGTCHTLYQLLNKCRSNPGKRLLRSWLRSPLCDERLIKERLDVVEALYNEHSTRSLLYDDVLRRVPDIPALAKRALQKKFTLGDCYRLYQVVKALGYFHKCLKELHDEQEKFQPSIRELVLFPIVMCRRQFEKFVILVERMVDIDHYHDTGDFRISPKSDPKLEEMDEKMEKLRAKCAKALEAVKEELENDTVKLDVNSQYGYFFRVTLKEEASIRQATTIRVIDSSKGFGVRFSTKQLDFLNEENTTLITEYEENQTQLRNMVLEIACGYLPAFEALTDVVSVIDVLVAFATLAATSCSTYVRPRLESGDSKAFINVAGCRHPVVEQSEHVHYIPNDLMNREGCEDKFIILTGANMGGKSTYLRSIAITVLMAQIGSFVPCEEAHFSLFDGIYTRIGAGDFQCEGISTFMAEMVDSANILRSATAKSLVIIDELGRGTSTFDGFGLAWAIAEYIVKTKRCFTMFATHFHEITELEKAHKGIRNMKVETHLSEDGKISLLYKVVDGVSNRSFGINVAQTVGFPKEIVTDASTIFAKLEATAKREEVADVVEELRKLANRKEHLSESEFRKEILRLIPQ